MIGEAVQRGLRQLGFAVDWVRDGASAEQAARARTVYLLLLISTAAQSGLELLRDLRRRGSDVPVVT